jgi:diguanylate cyclase (GGDEF)-like protein
MIDADDFKRINDRNGHAIGDRMLVRAAAILRQVCAPRGDFIARMGGDEFLILATRRSGEPLLLPQAIEEATAAFNAGAADEAVPLALSCGVAEFGRDGVHSLDALLSAADGAMYRNKIARKAARVL